MSKLVTTAIDSSAYGNTLKSQLERIKAYIAEIGKEAAFLELQASGVNVSSTSKLSEIAEAMLSIDKFSAADATLSDTGAAKTANKEEIVLDASGAATIKAGYYVNDVDVKAKSLEDQTSGTAAAADILDGKTAWVGGEQITGTSTTDLSGKEANNAAYASNTDSKLTINLKGSADGAADKIVTTGINYNPSIDSTVKVKRVIGPDDESESVIANSVTIPAGYYPEAVSVAVHVEDADGTEEKVLNVNSKAITGDQTFVVNDGKATVTFNPTADTLDYYTSVTLDKAVISDQDTTTGGYTITTAGWLNSDVSLTGLNAGTYVTTAHEDGKTDNGVTIVDGKAVINEASHGYTPTTISATLPVTPKPDDQTNVEVTADNETGKASFKTTVDLSAGYYEEGSVKVEGTVDLTEIAGSHTLESVTPTDTTAYTKTITTLYVDDTVTKGYLAADLADKYKVQDASLGTGIVTISTATVTIPVTAGWINNDVTFTMPTKKSAETFTPDSVGTTIDAGTYLTGDFTVSAVTVSNTNVTYDTASTDNIANVEGAKVTTKPTTGATTTYYDTVDMSSLLADMAAV